MSKFWGLLRTLWQGITGFFGQLSNGIKRLIHRMLSGIFGAERVSSAGNRYRAVRQRYRNWLNARFDTRSLSFKIFYHTAKTLILGFVLALLYVLTLETNFLNLTGEMPSVEELKNPKVAQSSEIYSYDKVLLGRFFTENRTPINYEDLPKPLIDALLATEDIRFYEHSGIDPRSLGRAAYGVLTGNSAGGGSTITQQLAKNLFKTRRRQSRGWLYNVPLLRTFILKTKEWLMAVKLERNFSKDQILTMYFNTVDFGSNAYGIKTAARTYFSKSPEDLNVQEAAVLVGLQKATTTYNPLIKRNFQKSLNRRNVVISQMEKYGYLTKPQADSIKKLPLKTRFSPDNPYAGPANYFKNAVVEVVKKWGEENGYDLYTDGLKIYTTVDSRMQALAEQAVTEKMKQLQRIFDTHWTGRNPWTDENGKEIPDFLDKVAQRTERYKALQIKYPNQPDSVSYYMKVKKDSMTVFSWNGPRKMYMTPMDSIAYYKRFLQAGMVAMDPHTGFIRTWVGGLNYEFFKYDHVKQGKRQPGSTFKPFVYATVIDDSTINLSPCDRRRDEPFRKEYINEKGQQDYWAPKNSAGTFSYSNMTLRRAMARSINSVTAQLTNDVATPERVVEYAHRIGIQSPLAAVPSVGLGSSDVSLYEMVAAYCTFANKGVYTEPLIVTRIEDRDGKLIEEFVPQKKQAIREESAFLMLHMLKGGLEEPGGTSQNLWSFDLFKNRNQVGGKTGTTSNNSDGWFMGVTRDLVVGAWVGGDDRSIHFRTTDLGEGAKTALPLVGRFLEKAYQDKSLKLYQGPFDKPTVKITKDYLNCPGGYEEEEEDSDTMDIGIPEDSLFVAPAPPQPIEPDDSTQRSQQF
ncbi:penicillin-binding protein 1A [Larkinella arboricola]|uniref:Penicillin-binding protein 1A n=1 Tax=Larkinella arboricola TaxID=643671 RepID=A0A327WTK7_LARAB|nr:transglycosylase domain-containing protein [Larkinella arboricola]RAJ94582.1 penicillin-binding protein 1A [Larkinella arboricola]